MNILALSNCQLKDNQGSGYVILTTAKSLKILGHEVDVIPPSSLVYLPSLAGKAFNYRMSVGIAKWIILNRERIRQYQLLIFFTAESSLALFILKRILRTNIPVILHSNGLEVKNRHNLQPYKELLSHSKPKWFHFNKSFLYKYCYRNVDAIITVSKDEQEFAIKELKISEFKVHSNEPCLPDVFYKNIKNNDKMPIITYCGRWTEPKGCKSMEKAIPIILEKFPHYKFRIIGCGEEFHVDDYFPASIISKIEVYTYIETKEAIIKLYNDSSIFLFPSLTESFGLVIAEAMACKCAVIAGPTGFAADLINNEEAIVLQIPNEVKILEALELLISNESLRHKLSENGRKRVELLSKENYINKLNSIINRTQFHN